VATIQIREVPEKHHEVLHRRAPEAGHSLQTYMRAQAIELAERPSEHEVRDELAADRR
jgi:hypothetical protein